MIIKENILFLREWLEYYRQLGVTEFHLYDNSATQETDFGSTGNRTVQLGRVNKRNVPFGDVVLLSDEELAGAMQEICADVPGVHVIPWSIKDEHGRVRYGQLAALNHARRMLADRVDWAINCDTDEFLVVPTDLPSLCQELEDAEYDMALFSVIRMADRWMYPEKNVLDIDLRPQKPWGPWQGKKYIYRPDRVSDLSIHDAYGADTKAWLPKPRGVLVHYNALPNLRDTGPYVPAAPPVPAGLRDAVLRGVGHYGSAEWRMSVLDVEKLRAWQAKPL